MGVVELYTLLEAQALEENYGFWPSSYHADRVGSALRVPLGASGPGAKLAEAVPIWKVSNETKDGLS